MRDDDVAKPSFSRTEVLNALRTAATHGLTETRNGTSDLLRFQYDIQGVEELLQECTDDELSDHEVSHYFPDFNDYIVELRIELTGERLPFYVKVALHMTNLEAGERVLTGYGELMSFHPWGMQR